MKRDTSLRTDKAYLHHICDEVDFLLTISKNLTYEKLLQNPILQRAIIRSLEVMGEASGIFRRTGSLSIRKSRGKK